jgi:hypothetical protein
MDFGFQLEALHACSLPYVLVIRLAPNLPQCNYCVSRVVLAVYLVRWVAL